MSMIKNTIVDFITKGNRPFRILLFGGIFIALIIMNVLAKIFNVDTKIGGDINLANAILIIVSILIGFGLSYTIIHLADRSKRQRDLN